MTSNSKGNLVLLDKKLPEETINRLRDLLAIAKHGGCTGMATVLLRGHGQAPITLITDNAALDKRQTIGALVELINDLQD